MDQETAGGLFEFVTSHMCFLQHVQYSTGLYIRNDVIPVSRKPT